MHIQKVFWWHPRMSLQSKQKAVKYGNSKYTVWAPFSKETKNLAMQSMNACTQINRQLLKVISTSSQPAPVHQGQQGFYTYMLNSYFLQLITDWHLIHNLPDWPWVNISIQINQLQQDFSLMLSVHKKASLNFYLGMMPMRVMGQETSLSIFRLFNTRK